MNAKNLALNLLIKAKDLASGTLEGFQGTVKETGDQADTLGESLHTAEQHTDDLEAALQQAEAQVDDTNEALKKAEKSTGHFADELSAADAAAGRFYDKQGKLREATGQFVAGAKRAEGATDKLGKKFDHTGRKADGLEGQVSSVSKKLKGFLIGGAALVGLDRLFSGAIQSSISFEKQLDRVQAVTNATADEMQQLESAAEHAGSTTKYTATQAAEGLEILARSGYTAGESVKLLPTLLNIATAEGIELGEAAQVLSDTLSIMGKEAEYGAEAADILAKGSSLSATTISQLGLAVSYAGAYAKDFNLDLADLTALLDVLAKNGMRGERAGVALRSILAQLSDPSSKASQELDKLGISTDNLNDMLDGLVAAGDNGKEAVLAFGVEAGPGLKALLSEGSEGIEAFKQQLQDASGAAQTMADIASDNLDGSILGVGSAWDALRRKLTDPLLQPLADLADELAAKFRELGPAFDSFGQIILAVLPRIQGTFKVVYNTFTLAAKSIGVFTSQIVSWAADTELALAKVLNKVWLVSDETVKALEIQAGGARAVLNAMKEEATQDISDLGDGFSLMWDGWADGAKKAADQQKEVREETEKTAQASQTAQQTIKDNADQSKQAITDQTQAVKQQDEAWKTLGLDAAEAVDGITQKGAEIIGAFSTIALSADATGQQITAAFTGAISKAKTKDEAEALIAILEEMGARGKLSATEIETALAGASRNLEALGVATGDAWKTLGLDMAVVKNQITDHGRAAVDALITIASQSDTTSADVQTAFNAMISKTTTLADLEYAQAAMTTFGKKGGEAAAAVRDKLQDVNDRINALKEETPNATGELEKLNEELASSGKTGVGHVGDLTEAMKELAEVVKTLAGEYKNATDEAEKLAETETDRKNSGAEKNSNSRRSSRSRLGASQYYDLTKSGNTEAATRFQELADAYGKTMEGLVLGPKGAEAMEMELNKLKQQALNESKRTSSTTPEPQPTTTSSSASRTVRLEFSSVGQPSVAGDFNEENADQLIRMLSGMGSISG